jgi:nucleosome binding factor SPN SPT16 subunit
MMEETKQRLSGRFEVHFYKKGSDNRETFEKIRQKLGAVKLGIPLGEKQAGSLAVEWYEYKGFGQIVDASQLISDVLAVKDEQEQGFINQSSQLTTRLFKRLIK